MKKLECILLSLILLLLMVGCGTPVTVKGTQLLSSGEIKSIRVSSLPEGYSFKFQSSDKIQKFADYFTNLHLIDVFEENPNEYSGMTWVIKITYSDNQEQTIYHFGKFIRGENGSWFKMDYEEAVQFETLLPLNE